MGWRLRQQKHPRISTPLALRISRLSILSIILIYAVTSLTAGVVAGVAMHYSRRDRSAGLGDSIRDALSSIWNPGDILRADGESVAYYLIAGLVTLGGVVLPVFLLGAFVFRLFKQDQIIWRKTVSIEDQLDGPPLLCFRFYNRTTSPIVNVSIRIVARVRSTGPPQFITNDFLDVLAPDRRTQQAQGFWMYGRTGVPFTVNVPLGSALTAEQIMNGNLICLPGSEEVVDLGRLTFQVLASGIVSDTGNTFFSAKEYSASEDLILGHFQEINPDYRTHPKSWAGWSHFDDNSDMFVFGYGSLVSPESVEKTLGHAVDRNKFRMATLRGWKRTWNVGSDATSHPERTLFLPNGEKFDGVMVVLGIEKATNITQCGGAVFPISSSDLSRLDVRERNYRRIDVTDEVTWAGKPPNCRVFTYEGLPLALERLERAKQAGRSIRVRKEYAELVEEAFAKAGQRETYLTSTKQHRFQVEDFRVVIDESLVPVVVRTNSPSYFESTTLRLVVDGAGPGEESVPLEVNPAET